MRSNSNSGTEPYKNILMPLKLNFESIVSPVLILEKK